MSNLYNNLRKTHETTDSGGTAITSSDDIAFSPGGFVLGQGSQVIKLPGYELDPNQKLWMKKMKKRRKKVKEDIDVRLESLHRDIVEGFDSLVNSSKLSLDLYISTLGYTKDLTPRNYLIGLLRRAKDLLTIRNSLNDDVGELELILTSLERRLPINKFELYNPFDYLYGARVQSNILKSYIVYEGSMDMTYVERESIQIADQELIDSLEEYGLRTIRIQNGKVYPVNRYFDRLFYRAFKEVIEDSTK